MTLFGDQDQDQDLSSGNASLLATSCSPRPPILALPDELLAAIFDFLWDCGPGGRLRSLAPASSTCQRFRRAAVPQIFNTISCAIDFSGSERSHASFEKLVGHPNLLLHVRTLNVRLPLRVGVVEAHDEESAQLQTWRPSQSAADLIIAKRASMPQLRTIRQVLTPSFCLASASSLS